MNIASSWRASILSGVVLLLAMTACQATELVVIREVEPPSATVTATTSAIARTTERPILTTAAPTAIPTIPLTATPTIPPTATVARRPTPDPPTLPAETATPENMVATPTLVEAADPSLIPMPFGLTTEVAAFKGDPNAPVVIIEFSDYQ